MVFSSAFRVFQGLILYSLVLSFVLLWSLYILGNAPCIRVSAFVPFFLSFIYANLPLFLWNLDFSFFLFSNGVSVGMQDEESRVEVSEE